MTLAATAPRVQYNGDGVTTSFSVTFTFWAATDLKVILTAADGVETTWDNGTQYTVTGGDGSTGTVVVSSSPTDYTPATGAKLTIKSNLPNVQATSLPLGGALPSTAIEEQVDRAVRLIQQQSETQDRSLLAAETDPSSISMVLPGAAVRANKIPAFDANGAISISSRTITEIESGAVDAAASAVDAETAQAAAETAQTNAETAETNAGTSETNAAQSAITALAATVGKYDANINIAFADSPYTVATLTADTLITVDTSLGNVVINFPASSGEDNGRLIGINKNGATNTITINRAGSDTIGGAALFVQYADTEWVDFCLDKPSTDWKVGNLSFTLAGAGLVKVGSTLSLDKTSDQTWTGAQRGAVTTDNDGSFDMSDRNNFNWTPSGIDVLEFTNETQGQSGNIWLVNPSGHAITLGAECDHDADIEALISTAGNYLIGYYCYDGTNVAVVASQALS